MTTLPNPFAFAATSPLATETAAAVDVHPPAAAGPIDEVARDVWAHLDSFPVPDADATDDIHEIFYHARKLIAEDARADHRFRLDVAAFMEAIEPMPLFLQRAAE